MRERENKEKEKMEERGLAEDEVGCPVVGCIGKKNHTIKRGGRSKREYKGHQRQEGT